ncbi:MAG: hypothetical protein ABS977_11555 [Pseudomonas qingdaonensis]|uniref:hypothetical protein n=1 Tax=Pseudomonas qingdaonensis TaxID=2056231 RepID=UPI003315CB6A
MQIQVILGDIVTGGRSRLQEVQDQMKTKGMSSPVIHAGAYSDDGLLQILEVRVVGGQREILVDDCTREQILGVLAWQTSVEEDSQFDDLVIYLVRRG